MNEERSAIVDIGSNTIRLVIFEVDEYYNVNEIQNIKKPSRLVQYLNEDNEMNQDGINELLNVVGNFIDIINSYDVDETVLVATAAVRQSTNSEEIKDLVEEVTQLPLRILSEKEEAYFGNYAIRYTMFGKDGVSIDIGGGSTELVWFENNEVKKYTSLPFGAVSLKDDFFDGKDYNDKKAIKKASNWVSEQLDEVDWLVECRLPIYAIGGSARNMAEVFQRDINYPIGGLHEYQMTPDDISATLDIFTSATKEEMEDLDGLSEDRVDSIIPATLVFKELIKAMDSNAFRISSRGLREGILLNQINRSHPHAYEINTIQPQTIVRTARKYGISSFAVNQRIIIANNLLRELKKFDLLDLSEDLADLYYYGIILYSIGSYIEDDAKAQHSFYIVSNINLHGFSHKKRLALALIASFKNKSLFKQNLQEFDGWFSDDEYDLLLKLGSITKFADALGDAQVNYVKDIELKKVDDDNFELYVSYSGTVISEEYRGNKQKNHFERVLDGDVELFFIDNVN